MLKCEAFLSQLAVEHSSVIYVQLLSFLEIERLFLHRDISTRLVSASLSLPLCICFYVSCRRLLSFALTQTENFYEELNEKAFNISTGNDSVRKLSRVLIYL